VSTQRSVLPSLLEAGYQRFRTVGYAAEHERYRRLGEEGQRPSTMVIACSDSRSAPETIFDAGPGELFVVRNVAALVPPYAPDGAAHAASAALEFAVLALEVSSIVVMGHGRCGGIAAALAPGSPLTETDFIGTWVAGLRELLPALDPDGDPLSVRLALERASVARSIAHLGTFPWIRSRAETGALALVGSWFDIPLGELWAMDASGWARIDA
jgi:carbonic anhydrase